MATESEFNHFAERFRVALQRLQSELAVDGVLTAPRTTVKERALAKAIQAAFDALLVRVAAAGDVVKQVDHGNLAYLVNRYAALRKAIADRVGEAPGTDVGTYPAKEVAVDLGEDKPGESTAAMVAGALVVGIGIGWFFGRRE